MKSEVHGRAHCVGLTGIDALAPFGPWRCSVGDFVPAHSRPGDRDALYSYLLNRYNTSSPSQLFLPDNIVSQVGYASYVWVSIKGYEGRFFTLEFTEGPVTKAYMEEQDRKYLSELAQADPEKFLKEMSPRGELSAEDQEKKLGLDLSLPHHQNLQREFAADVVRIRAERSTSATDGGATASAAEVGAADDAGSASLSPPLYAAIVALYAEVCAVQSPLGSVTSPFVNEEGSAGAGSSFDPTSIAEPNELAAKKVRIFFNVEQIGSCYPGMYGCQICDYALTIQIDDFIDKKNYHYESGRGSVPHVDYLAAEAWISYMTTQGWVSTSKYTEITPLKSFKKESWCVFEASSYQHALSAVTNLINLTPEIGSIGFEEPRRSLACTPTIVRYFQDTVFPQTISYLQSMVATVAAASQLAREVLLPITSPAPVEPSELVRLHEEMEQMRIKADEREVSLRAEMRRAAVLAAEETRHEQVPVADEAAHLREREENERLRREVASRVSVVPFREIRASDIEYVFDETGIPKKIGSGNFSEVFEGRYSGAGVAVKRLRVAALNSAEQDEFRSEAMVHANMRHPNIVMLLAVCLEVGHFALVMEYMTGGSLYSLLHSGVMLSWSNRIDMAKQLVAGVMYLHGLSDHIVHRDLKSANVLVARPYREEERVELKISDFGLAKIKDASSSTSRVGVAGTVAWTAPEAFDDEPALTKKSDVYSLGVVFWEIASCRVPYAGLGIAALMRKIITGQTNPIPDGTPPEFTAIIQDCWKLDPRERPEARELMPRIDALAAGFFGGGAGGGEASAAGPMYDGLSPTYH